MLELNSYDADRIDMVFFSSLQAFYYCWKGNDMIIFYRLGVMESIVEVRNYTFQIVSDIKMVGIMLVFTRAP